MDAAIDREPPPAKGSGRCQTAAPWAIIFLIVTETALFTIFVVAYVVYIGKSLTGHIRKTFSIFPSWPVSACSLAASPSSLLKWRLKKHRLGHVQVVVAGHHFAGLGVSGLHRLSNGDKLIYEDHLTVSTNLFGTTFYSLVGLHASHVIVGMCFLIL